MKVTTISSNLFRNICTKINHKRLFTRAFFCIFVEIRIEMEKLPGCRWIESTLILLLLPWYIYKNIKKIHQKKREKKIYHEKYKHLYLPKGEFEKRFPQIKKAKKQKHI